MASRVFLDANLLLDITLQRQGSMEAIAILKMGIDKEIVLFTTPAVLHVVSYYTGREFGAQQTKLIILTLLNDVLVIDCDQTTAIMALNSKIDDTEDAFQYYTALKHDIDYFVSADKKLRKAALPLLPVYTAAELLKEFGK